MYFSSWTVSSGHLTSHSSFLCPKLTSTYTTHLLLYSLAAIGITPTPMLLQSSSLGSSRTLPSPLLSTLSYWESPRHISQIHLLSSLSTASAARQTTITSLLDPTMASRLAQTSPFSTQQQPERLAKTHIWTPCSPCSGRTMKMGVSVSSSQWAALLLALLLCFLRDHTCRWQMAPHHIPDYWVVISSSTRKTAAASFLCGHPVSRRDVILQGQLSPSKVFIGWRSTLVMTSIRTCFHIKCNLPE